jgi:hypothetical protein
VWYPCLCLYTTIYFFPFCAVCACNAREAFERHELMDTFLHEHRQHVREWANLSSADFDWSVKETGQPRKRRQRQGSPRNAQIISMEVGETRPVLSPPLAMPDSLHESSKHPQKPRTVYEERMPPIMHHIADHDQMSVHNLLDISMPAMCKRGANPEKLH